MGGMGILSDIPPLIDGGTLNRISGVHWDIGYSIPNSTLFTFYNRGKALGFNDMR